MKKVLIPFIFIACLIVLTCCSNDESEIELTGEYIEATTWDAELTGSAYPNHTPISSHFVMQFLSKESGKCIPAYGDDSYEGSFRYHITKDMITFNGAIVGNWTVVERAKTRMILRAFLPNEFKLVLTRM
ncbi:MAG: hypothetical protein K2I64_05615 [Muribaculaceae bacterium]|nr:hypothetical protein [Muribaculaceae bacterium]